METILLEKSIDLKDLDNCRWDPATGGASAIMGTMPDLTTSLVGIFTKPVQESRKCREQHVLSSPDDPVHNCSSTSASAPTFGGTDKKASSSSSLDKCGERIIGLSEKLRRQEHGPIRQGCSASAKSLDQSSDLRIQGHERRNTARLDRRASQRASILWRVRDHGQVTDWKSGAVVAGKNLVWGMGEGISDIAVKPYMGAKWGGTLGTVRALEKGWHIWG